jgi:hypothetical protein
MREHRIQTASYPRNTFADIPLSAVDYNEFYQILNRPDGWRPAGTEGPSPLLSPPPSTNTLPPQTNSSRASKYSTRKAAARSARASCATS